MKISIGNVWWQHGGIALAMARRNGVKEKQSKYQRNEKRNKGSGVNKIGEENRQWRRRK
jgi:hypothetical protein